MTKQESDINKYRQWKCQTIADMTKKEFSELMKLLQQGKR